MPKTFPTSAYAARVQLPFVPFVVFVLFVLCFVSFCCLGLHGVRKGTALLHIC